MSQVVDYTTDLDELARLAAQPEALDDVLTRALDALGELVPYDLAAVLELVDNELQVRAARGPLANDKVRAHHLALEEFPTVRSVLSTRKARAFLEDDHSGDEGDPYDGVLDLPHGHSCMVVPLFAGERTLGAITLDRSICNPYPDSTVALAGVVGQIVSLAMAYAEQASLLRRYKGTLEERAHILQREVQSGGMAAKQLAASRAPNMRPLIDHAKAVAVTSTPVLIQGETGTGKEVLAHAIHEWSDRPDGPFVKINCAAIPDSLVESELFGHVKGAFSGADKARAGRFLTANGGTLLLDEIGEMPLDLQSKLLRVLQEGTFEAVGSDRTVKVDVRVIAATHVDLEKAVAEGKFREDLYYRLEVFPLHLPPLRERVEDIPAIADAILRDLAERSGRGPWMIDEETEACMQAQCWPGNVRELKNALERATILVPAGVIESAHMHVHHRPGALPVPAAVHNEGDDMVTLAENERRYVERVLRHTRGRVYGEGGAAEVLGVRPTTLQSRMKKLGIERCSFTA